jgi:hypothetical protein
MTTVVAAYGYLSPDDDPRQWQPHGIVEAPDELIAWLDGAAGAQVRVSA